MHTQDYGSVYTQADLNLICLYQVQCLLYNLGPFRSRFGELGRKVRTFYFREFGITSHYFQRAGEKLLKKV